MNRALIAFACLGFVGCATAPVGDGASGSGPKYGPSATRLYDSQTYVRKQPAPDYWALAPYYLPQRSGSGCSSATAAMVVNAARASRKLTTTDELAVEDKMVKRVGDADWIRTAGGGGGRTLDQLGELMPKALKAYGVDATVEVHHANEAGAQKLLHDQLVKNEKSAQDFIISNFLQSVYTGDPEGEVGHFAPVAAYDASTKRVLLMDPDRDFYEPYWVSEETFFKGMNTQDRFGAKTRGWIWVHLK